MIKKKIVIVLVLVIGLACIAAGFIFSSKMEEPDDPQAIIDSSLKSVLGVDEQKRSIAGIALNNCSYSVEFIKPRRNRVDVMCHVKSADVKSALEHLANSDESMDQKAFLDAFDSLLSESEPVVQNVTVKIIETEEGYAAEFDEKTADAFVGGLIEFTEQFIVDMNNEEK